MSWMRLISSGPPPCSRRRHHQARRQQRPHRSGSRAVPQSALHRPGTRDQPDGAGVGGHAHRIAEGAARILAEAPARSRLQDACANRRLPRRDARRRGHDIELGVSDICRRVLLPTFSVRAGPRCEVGIDHCDVGCCHNDICRMAETLAAGAKRGNGCARSSWKGRRTRATLIVGSCEHAELR